MSIVSFRIDDEVKKRMERLRHLNWSALLRQYVATRVEEEEAKVGVLKDRARIRKASVAIDELRARSPAGWSGAEVVLQWRKLRR